MNKKFSSTATRKAASLSIIFRIINELVQPTLVHAVVDLDAFFKTGTTTNLTLAIIDVKFARKSDEKSNQTLLFAVRTNRSLVSFDSRILPRMLKLENFLE